MIVIGLVMKSPYKKGTKKHEKWIKDVNEYNQFVANLEKSTTHSKKINSKEV